MCWYFGCFTDNFSKITSNNYLSKFHHCSNCRGSPIWKGGQEQLTQRNVFQFLYSSFQISLNGDSVLVSSLLGKRQLNSRPTRHELYARLAPLVDKSTSSYQLIKAFQKVATTYHQVSNYSVTVITSYFTVCCSRLFKLFCLFTGISSTSTLISWPTWYQGPHGCYLSSSRCRQQGRGGAKNSSQWIGCIYLAPLAATLVGGQWGKLDARGLSLTHGHLWSRFYFALDC